MKKWVRNMTKMGVHDMLILMDEEHGLMYEHHLFTCLPKMSDLIVHWLALGSKIIKVSLACRLQSL